eukprot:Gb_35023 [translate_table: standard]
MIDSVGSSDTDIVGEPKTDIVGEHQQDIGIDIDRLGRSHRQRSYSSTPTEPESSHGGEVHRWNDSKDFIHDRQGGTVTIKHIVKRTKSTDREEPELFREQWNSASRQVQSADVHLMLVPLQELWHTNPVR